MKRIFHIETGVAADTDVILCELSLNHICIARAMKDAKQLHQLSYYQLRELLEAEKLKDVFINEGLNANVASRFVLCNAIPEVILIPQDSFTEQNAHTYFTTINGYAPGKLYFDELKTDQLVLAHAVPKSIADYINTIARFETFHLYSCQLRMNDAGKTGDKIHVYFTNKEFSLLVRGKQKPLLAQTYPYTTPMDVVYYLLAVCNEYGLSQTETEIVLSGLVSEDSAMYKELFQYFSQLRFWDAGQTPILQSEYQPHFFSSMYNLASCVL